MSGMRTNDGFELSHTAGSMRKDAGEWRSGEFYIMKEQSNLMTGTWLALDTSTAAMTIALVRSGEAVAKSDSLSERNHSIRLLPAVEELLASQGMKAKDLAGVAVGHGPGSYTGIRIGVTVAKMLA